MSEAWNDDRTRDLAAVIAAVGEAGEAIMRAFGGPHEVAHKTPDQPVTAADLEADRIVRRILGEARPEYGWLSEETADRPDRLEARRVWIVDPIDGTRSYIAGIPEFAISVGLAEAGRAVLGVVYNPAKSELYTAIRGRGAYLATLEAGRTTSAVAEELAHAPGRRLSVTRGSSADQVVLLASRSEIAAGEFDPFAGEWRVEPTGSTAYKLARIAAGVGDVFLSRGPKSEWDVCAGELLVEEAGGRATDLDGSEFRYNRPDPQVHGVLASNGRMHDYVLGVVETMPAPKLEWQSYDPLHPGLPTRTRGGPATNEDE